VQQLYGFGREAVTLALTAATQAVLMSGCQTLRPRDQNPLNTVVSVLRTSIEISRSPPLPSGNTASGGFLARLMVIRLLSGGESCGEFLRAQARGGGEK
jgi:hypothetical protein